MDNITRKLPTIEDYLADVTKELDALTSTKSPLSDSIIENAKQSWNAPIETPSK